jgi:hypothetical protein
VGYWHPIACSDQSNPLLADQTIPPHVQRGQKDPLTQSNPLLADQTIPPHVQRGQKDPLTQSNPLLADQTSLLNRQSSADWG